jgi:hypothetical protein
VIVSSVTQLGLIGFFFWGGGRDIRDSRVTKSKLNKYLHEYLFTMAVHCGVVNITTDEALDELTKNRKIDLII